MIDFSKGGRILLMNVELPNIISWGPLGPVKRWFFERFLRARGIYHRNYLIGMADVYLPTCVLLRLPVVLRSPRLPIHTLHTLIGQEITLKPLGSFWGAPIYLGEFKEEG